MLRFRDLHAGRDVEVEIGRVVIAGFTGRSRAAAMAHVQELSALGVPVPDRIPAFYTVDPSLLTTAATIRVAGRSTSGEVEPVVVCQGGRRWLTVGSDHTDRDLERTDIQASKAACPKPLAAQLVPLDAVGTWDAVQLTSHVDGALYQRGTLGELLALDRLLNELEGQAPPLSDGDVLFLGTLPVVGGQLRTGTSFQADLRYPRGGGRISLVYDVITP